MARSTYQVGQIRRNNEVAILGAAEQEFASHGFSGTSISRIAERAGVPRSNVHYYFQSKEDLYRRLLVDVVQLWNDAFPEITPDDDPAVALESYIRAKLEFSRTSPLISKIYADEILRGAPVLREYLEQNYASWLQGKVKVIRSWIRQGKMDKVDPLHLIFMIWSTTQHYADFDVQVKTALGKKDYTKRDFERIAATITHIIIQGCGIKRPASARA
ncbi:MAG: TetR/AcrR family transcriptional regulator [Halioglobus sp.]|jgi:TetR/AcrR family transcriptional regulator